MSWHTAVVGLRALVPQALASVLTLVLVQLGVSQECAAQVVQLGKLLGL